MLELAIALIPLFALLVSLLCGHYPGVETIVAISARFGTPSPHRTPTRQAPPRAPRAHAVRGGLLLALGFAQRPPPLAA